MQLLKKCWCPLLCMQQGKMNKRRAYVSGEPSHLRVPVRTRLCPTPSLVMGCLVAEGTEKLLLARHLQWCLQLSGRSQVSAADILKGKTKQQQQKRNRNDLHGSQASFRNLNFGLVNMSFTIIFYLVKQNLCQFFVLTQKTLLSKDS